MPSPVPKPDARKQRHAIAQQSAARLPIAGRVGRPPKPPLELGTHGRRWWQWAWATPQATAWHKGFTEPLARRAALEDEYEAMGVVERSRVLPAMLRLDEAFGLTPKAAVAQHLVFVDEPTQPKVVDDPAKVTAIRPRLKGMRDT